MAASELCWLRNDPPSTCRQFFADEYPAMRTIEGNLAMITACGYETVDHFTLPDTAWWESYYGPLERRLQSLRRVHGGDPPRMAIIASIQREIDIFRQYASHYG